MMEVSRQNGGSGELSAALVEWLAARPHAPSPQREMALALAAIVDAGSESAFAAYQELQRVMAAIRRLNRLAARQAEAAAASAVAPEAEPAAVAESARDLTALVGAYGRGDVDAFNAMMSALEVGELRSLLSVACGLLRQCELRMGQNLTVRPAEDLEDGPEGV
ncbi:hypothetical protein [Streptomyces sp. CAI-85]|uniref:hypothetical protein n=1 Tax=Streptomyces sp. CAI-85 TaxID=1472662 RepID=UPI001587C41B|nr:hypothetical protein [Streptomyces sp. CAI-85]NUV63245.1 hypothetical protein [Streptomyces sp. CAI-85]